MPSPRETWSKLSPATSQVLICDLQKEIVARSKTNPPDALAQSVEVLCKIAKLLEVPITLSVVPENEDKPKLIPELQEFVTPANEFLRATASPFLEKATREHLASLARPTLILAGFATEVVVLHAAVQALQEGYGVIVAVDACGGSSERTESAAFEQIREAGGVVSSVVSIATAWSPDFATTQGKQMFEIVQTLRLA